MIESLYRFPIEATMASPKSDMALGQKLNTEFILRKIFEKVDFDFIYGEVKETYGVNGNVSVPPPAILKMMLLLVLSNVRSERELMETIPGRMERVTEILAKAKVNIRAFTVSGTYEYGVMKFLVDKPDKGLEALSSQGIPANKREILAVLMDDRPGGLYRIAN